MPKASPLIVALDYADADQAYALAARLDPQYCRLKVGKELFTVGGPRCWSVCRTKALNVFSILNFTTFPPRLPKPYPRLPA